MTVDIAALAKLARLEISEDEMTRLQKEIPAILAFVEIIQKAKTGKGPSTGSGLHNVMRADENSHESGKYTNQLLDAAPAREGNRIAVKQVISRKKK